MPELPEVETVRRVLGPLCAGRRIERVSVRRPEVIAHPGAEEFCTRLAGREIAGLGRRGKFLSILLADGGRVTLHLRMTGCLLLAPADHPEERHTHVVFALDAIQDPVSLFEPVYHDGGDTVYITNTGKKYHRDGCSSLSKSKIPKTRSEAEAMGLEPCKNCRP